MLAVSPNAYRQNVKDAIVSALRARDDVTGCWEGGSAATGRVDEFSDIDLMIVAPLDSADAIFADIEAAISNIDEIVHRWHVDPPPFQDSAQRFYFVAGAPRFFAVDCVIVTDSGAAPFLERERHGEPQDPIRSQRKDRCTSARSQCTQSSARSPARATARRGTGFP